MYLSNQQCTMKLHYHDDRVLTEEILPHARAAFLRLYSQCLVLRVGPSVGGPILRLQAVVDFYWGPTMQASGPAEHPADNRPARIGQSILSAMHCKGLALQTARGGARAAPPVPASAQFPNRRIPGQGELAFVCSARRSGGDAVHGSCVIRQPDHRDGRPDTPMQLLIRRMPLLVPVMAAIHRLTALPGRTVRSCPATCWRSMT